VEGSAGPGPFHVNPCDSAGAERRLEAGAEQWWPHQAGDGLSLTTGTDRPCGGCPSNETWGLAGHLHLRCWGRVPWDGGGFANFKTEPFFCCTKYSFPLRSTSFFYDTIAVCGLLHVHPIASRFRRFPRHTRGLFAHFDFQVPAHLRKPRFRPPSASIIPTQTLASPVSRQVRCRATTSPREFSNCSNTPERPLSRFPFAPAGKS
jgi:hypothetical protein